MNSLPIDKPNETGPLTRAAWRALLRSRRKQLPIAERRRAEARIVHTLAASAFFRPQRRVALYASSGSEVSTDGLLQLAARRGCRIYLPRIADYDRQQLCFAPLGVTLIRNRHGIYEPRHPGRAIDPACLSVIILPLTGFDAYGTRLGSGAGYYDRALAALTHRPRLRPLLIGLAFACQRAERLPREAHDVPLDAVCTERGLRWFPS